jgi:hypothetical protein
MSENLGGRPTDYKDNYCKEAFDLLSSKAGNGVTALAAHFGVDERTIYNWRRTHAEFKKAVDSGTAASKKLFLNQALEYIVSTRDANYNAPLFSKLMQCIYRESESSPFVIDGWSKSLTALQKIELVEEAVAVGDITADQGKKLIEIISKRLEITEFAELQKRIEALEQKE